MVGDRLCHYQSRERPTFTDPKPFKAMELLYERAYGGVDVRSDPKVPCIYARNHLGRGFVVKNLEKAVESLPLPNLEDPADRLTPDRLCVGKFWEWERQPMPAAFGWFSKYWRPRALYAGVMPADRLVEQELRAMYAQAVPRSSSGHLRANEAARKWTSASSTGRRRGWSPLISGATRPSTRRT